MIPYTVLLLVPDAIADAFGQETFMTHASVNPSVAILPRDVGAFAAIGIARDNAMDAYKSWDDVGHEDWHVLAVFPGHLENIKPESA